MKINRPRLFAASCIAMVTLAVTFAVRVDTLSAVGVEFDLSHQQQGLIITAVSWAYPAAIFVVGPMCDALGMGRLLILASVVHVAGITLTVFSPAFGFPVLLFATVLIGLADGVAEAVFNPLVTTIYPEDKTGRLTRLHAFWPAGLVLGGIACLALSPLFGLNRPGVSAEAVSLSWKVKFALALIPACLYGALAYGQKFPSTERAASGVSAANMFREALRPGFLILLGCMVFTAVTEVGPDQWMGSVMTDTVGIRGIIYLVYTAGIMFVMRTYAGTLVRFMTPFVLLAVSCVLGGGGILWLSYVTTPGVAFAAATVFGMGKALLWPILLGVTAERYPKGGAFLLALMGGTGMVAAGLAGPVLGHVYDTYTVRNLPAEVARVVVVDGRYSPAARDKLQSPVALAAVREAEKHGAAMTFRCVALTPVLPLVVYVLLFFYHRSQGGYRTIRIGKARREG